MASDKNKYMTKKEMYINNFNRASQSYSVWRLIWNSGGTLFFLYIFWLPLVTAIHGYHDPSVLGYYLLVGVAPIILRKVAPLVLAKIENPWNPDPFRGGMMLALGGWIGSIIIVLIAIIFSQLIR